MAVTQEDFTLEAQKRIENFARIMKNVANNEHISAITSETTESITNGDDLYLIAMQDVQVAFELLYKERDLKDIPFNAYQAILRHTESERKIATVEAVKQYYKNRIDGSVSLKYYMEEEYYPRFLEIIKDRTEAKAAAEISQQFVELIQDLSEAGISDPLHKMFRTSNDIQLHIQDEVHKMFDRQDYNDEISNAANPQYEEYEVSTTQLGQAAEEIIALNGKDLRNRASRKTQARADFSKDHNADLKGLTTPVDESLLDLATTLMMTPTQSNMIMIAEKGMDTSGIVTRIAEDLLRDNVPAKIGGGRIVEIDLEKMTTYLSKTGDAISDQTIDPNDLQSTRLENSLHTLFSAVDKHNKSGKPPVFLSLSGFEQAVKPSSILGGKLDEFFTYWLTEDHDVRIIAEMSKQGLETVASSAPDLYKLLNCHELKTPSVEQTTARVEDWLHFGRGRVLSEQYQISPSVLEKAVKLSNKHISKDIEAQPGLTTTILTLAATSAEKRKGTEINEDDVVNAVITKSGKPRTAIVENTNDKIDTLGDFMRANLINQEPAISKVEDLLELFSGGEKEKDKPIGVLFFHGPTGVGKTEAASLLAEHLNAGLVSIEMANYSDKGSVTQLLGASASYVGYGEKTKLEEIEDNFLNVVLLDELEKAHPEIIQTFMNGFDKGVITLRNNKQVNVENCIFIMTSNIAEAQAQHVTGTIGFAGQTIEQKKSELKAQAIIDSFPPEIRNRIDATINFNDLDRDNVAEIAKNIKLAKLIATLKEDDKAAGLELSEEAFDQLLDEGFKEGMGGRPLNRAIRDKIKLPLMRWRKANSDVDASKQYFTVKSLSPEFEVVASPNNPETAEASNDNAKLAAKAQKKQAPNMK